jgi:hypothetical protein
MIGKIILVGIALSLVFSFDFEHNNKTETKEYIASESQPGPLDASNWG